MDDRMTEIYRNCCFRLFPVTEISRSPFRGADVFGGLNGLRQHNSKVASVSHPDELTAANRPASAQQVEELVLGIERAKRGGLFKVQRSNQDRSGPLIPEEVVPASIVNIVLLGSFATALLHHAQLVENTRTEQVFSVHGNKANPCREGRELDYRQSDCFCHD